VHQILVAKAFIRVGDGDSCCNLSVFLLDFWSIRVCWC